MTISKNSTSRWVAVSLLLGVSNTPLLAAPTVSGTTISWPNDGWYQVQSIPDYTSVCQGGTSCTVSPGRYVVINHSTKERFENIVVEDSTTPNTNSITVTGNTISWPNDGWYQVQNASNYQSVCQGTTTCVVTPGDYIVINHTTGKRTKITVDSNSGGGGTNPPTNDTITVNGLTLSWPNDGWYQVQNASNYNSVCQGGQSCTVQPGVYNVINHTTGKRFNGIEVSGSGTDTGGVSHASTAIPVVSATANDPHISSAGRNRAASLSDALAVITEVVHNQGTSAGLSCNTLGAQYNSCSIVNIHIKDANGSLNATGWKLYFHSTRRILQAHSNDFTVSHVNGDLHYIEANNAFSGFAGGVKTLKLIVEYNQLVESDFQPRFWVARGNTVQLIANTNNDTNEDSYAMNITGNNRYEFVGETNKVTTSSARYNENTNTNSRAASLSSAEIQARIIPAPNSISLGSGTLDISGGFSFANSDLSTNSKQALQTRQSQFMSTNDGTPLIAIVDSSLPANSYALTVKDNGISLSGSDQTQLFYAAQSLLSLVQLGKSTIPQVIISDSPRFEYRGVQVDVARNFHSVTSIKRLMEQMAAYKLNKLHLHLSDDEGWRLAISALPELTSVGGKRAFNVDSNGEVSELNGLMPAMGSGPDSSNQGSGFYTRAQFVDLLRFAAARHIEVIPEFDMPAHARAAVVAMRVRAHQLGKPNDTSILLDDPNDTSRYLTVQNYDDSFINPCVDGTYSFIETVVDEVKSMYTSAGASLSVWHMGGDEASNIFKGAGFNGQNTSAYDYPWEKSPVCQRFIANTSGVSSRTDLTPYFLKRVASIVANAGIPALYAYQDIYGTQNANAFATQSSGASIWATASTGNAVTAANALSNRGFDTIITSPDYLYFDVPYEVDPDERGYYWASRHTDTQKVFTFSPENLPQNAATSVNRYGNTWSSTGQTTHQGYTGMQAALWSETVRTPEQFDQMLFPRLLAHAERAWHRADWELDYSVGQTFNSQSSNVDYNAIAQDYAVFAAALGRKELAKLDAAGVLYRVPLAGASTTTGTLNMNSAYPGLSMQYSSNGSTWQNWNSTAKPANATAVRIQSADGQRTGRSTPVE